MTRETRNGLIELAAWIVVTTVILGLLWTDVAKGEEWLSVTPNVVLVQAGSSMGSGAVVCADPQTLDTWTITCHHVVGESQAATVTWPNGYSAAGTVVGTGRTYDTALIKARGPDASFLPIATEPAPAGTEVIALGYGGQRGPVRNLKLISWKSRVLGYKRNMDDLIQLEPYAESGDSGGPIVDLQGRLVGIVQGGQLTGFNGQAADTHGSFQRPVLNLLREYVPQQNFQQCYPCYPPSGAQIIQSPYQPVQQGPRQIVQIPPRTPIQKPDLPLPPGTEQPPSQGNPPGCADPAACPAIASLVEQIKKLDEEIKKSCGQPGPAGPPGEPGPPGPEGPAGEPPLVKEIVDGVVARIKGDESLLAMLKGPPGPPGPAGPSGATPEVTPPPLGTAWSHLVLIAPPKAEYSARLGDEAKRAQGHYNGLKVVDPPTDKNIGPLPVLVAYQDGSPVKSFVGLRAVSDALSAVTRGDFDRFLF